MKMNKIISIVMLVIAGSIFTGCLSVNFSNSNSNVLDKAMEYKYIPYIEVTMDYGDANMQPVIQKIVDDAVAATFLTVEKNLESLTDEQKQKAFDVEFSFEYNDASKKAKVQLYLYDYTTGEKLAEFEASRYANFEESLSQCLDVVFKDFAEKFAK